jgi:ABC-type uncharacterized transport system substrate-binding protein
MTATKPGIRPTRILLLLLLASAALASGLRDANAHPHVWAKSRVEILHSDGVFKGLRHSWTFDEMFSSFATFGLARKDGTVAADQLAALAARYVRSLKPYGYFTHARQNGRPLSLGEPVDSLVEYDGGVLTLHFRLPSVGNAGMEKLEFEIYDSTYFVDLSPDEERSAILSPPAENCRVSSGKRSPGRNVDESFLSSLAATGNWAAEFAITVAVECK